MDLGKEVNHDGTATAAASDEGDFDGAGWSYDGDLLPAAGPFVRDGVTYHAPDPSGTAENFVEARGQAMLLPAGSYGTLRLVAAAHHGPVTTLLTVRYTDGTTDEVPVTVGDWAAAPRRHRGAGDAAPDQARAGGGRPAGAAVRVLRGPRRLEDRSLSRPAGRSSGAGLRDHSRVAPHPLAREVVRWQRDRVGHAATGVRLPDRCGGTVPGCGRRVRPRCPRTCRPPRPVSRSAAGVAMREGRQPESSGTMRSFRAIRVSAFWSVALSESRTMRRTARRCVGAPGARCRNPRR